MRKLQLQKVRAGLVKRLEELRAQTAAGLRSQQDKLGYTQDEPRDEPDEAQRIQEQDTAMIMNEREAALAQQIEQAIVRIDAGSFGECIDCGNDIEVERLIAIPWALRCITDQEELESRQRDVSPSL